MAPDVTFAWFIRHFTLSGELLLTASQISSCLLSSNCLWLTFSKILKQDDEQWWRMWSSHSLPRGELCEMCSFPVVTPMYLSLSPQTQSGIQLLTKACDEAKKLSDDHSVARKTPNLSSFGQKKNFNGIISIFLWHHCLGVKDLLYGECWTSIYPAITRRQLGIIRW